MADESNILVRLRLLGAGAFSREAREASRSLGGMENPAERASRSIGNLHRTSGRMPAVMAAMESGAGHVASGLSRIERTAKVVGLALGGVATVSGIAGVKFNAQFQSLNTSFRTLLGNDKKAEAFVETLRSVTMGTPFKLSDVADYSRGLLGVGMAAEKVPPTLRAIGMATMATGGTEETYRRISEILGVIQAKGKLGRDEITRLAQAGVPVDRILRKQLGLSAEQMERIADQEIPASKAIEAIADGWSKRYKTAFEDAAGDWNVQMMDARKNIEQIQRLAAKPLFGWLNETAAPWFLGQMRRVINVLNHADVSMGQRMAIILNKVALPTAARGGARLLQMLGFDVRPGDVMRVLRQVITGIQAGGRMIASGVSTVMAHLPAIVEGVRGVVTDVIEAIRPAMPFVQNVVIPLLTGIGKGVLSSIVVAFKIAIPMIRTAARFLGWLGEKAKPLRPVIETIGVAIGFLASGPILGGIARLGNTFAKAGGLVGRAGKLIEVGAKLAAIPMRILDRVIRTAANALRVFVSGTRSVIGALGRAWTYTVRWVGFMQGVPGKIARVAVNLVSGFVNRIASLGPRLRGAAGRALSSAAGAIRGMGKGFFNAAGVIGRNIVNGVVNAIKAAPGAVAAAIKSIVPGPLRSAVSSMFGGGNAEGRRVGASPGVNIGANRQGGVTRGWSLVGEAGPEIASFHDGARIHSARDTRRMLASALGGVQNRAVSLAGLMVPVEVTTIMVGPDGREMHRTVERQERRLQERK